MLRLPASKLLNRNLNLLKGAFLYITGDEGSVYFKSYKSSKINSDFTSTAKEQPPEREITYICGLGAKVGCERLSEHSTCSDESHKYRLFLFLVVSTLLRKSGFFE